MEQRLAGEYTTHETRALSHEKVDKQKRYSQIVECLIEGKELTAKECAVMMMKKGYVPTSERNFTAPRLNEMMNDGVVEPIGKVECEYTHRPVTVYALREEN